MPKVSIIIVSFNVQSYLVSAIDSILKSNYSNYEIIIVDNNSYDNTVDIISDKYPKVNILSNVKNVGFSNSNLMAIVTENIFVHHDDDSLVFYLQPAQDHHHRRRRRHHHYQQIMHFVV